MAEFGKLIIVDIGIGAVKGAIKQPLEEVSDSFCYEWRNRKSEMVEPPEWKPFCYAAGAVVTVLVIPVDLSYGALKGEWYFCQIK